MISGGTIVTEPFRKSVRVPLPERDDAAEEALAQIRESLHGLKFGSVNIIVQDGVIIQIDRTEKKRLRSPKSNT